MENKKIIFLGKLLFWTFFILGNISLFGFIITNKTDFALGGYVLLVFGSVINLLVIAFLVVYGLFNKSQLRICLQSSAIICINIPIAVLYYFIGISLLNI